MQQIDVLEKYPGELRRGLAREARGPAEQLGLRGLAAQGHRDAPGAAFLRCRAHDASSPPCSDAKARRLSASSMSRAVMR